MEDEKLARVKEIHTELRDITKQWAIKRVDDLKEASRLRREAIRLNHQRYIKFVPLYRQLAEDLGAPDDADIEFLSSEMVSTDDIFKSYNPEYLGKSDFERMTRWLESIYIEKINMETADVHSVSSWIHRLAENGIYSTFSSGTTGRLSFVPRDEYNWHSFTNNSASFLPYFLTDLDVEYADFDLVSLSFRGGNMGVGLVGQRLSLLAKRSYFLYEAEISPDALRVMRKGAANDDEKRALDEYYDQILSRADENLDRIIGNIFESTHQGRRSMKIFGAPFQFKQLCERMISSKRTIELMPGSTISFGGGWKSFEGERIERTELIGMIKEAFGLEQKYIFEGFSMTEMNVSLMRCLEGRYHLPPLIEPIIYDDSLSPLKGEHLTGGFGYLDPFATSYPGFLVSGDIVDLVDDKCACGRIGPAIVGEVQRASGREVKGCGGIMSEMRA